VIHVVVFYGTLNVTSYRLLEFLAFLEDNILITLHKVIELVEVPCGFRVHYLLSWMGPFF